MRVRVVAFARLRELLGGGSHEVEIVTPATVADLWAKLVQQCAEIAPLAASTRIARNGRVVDAREPLNEGDEIALLPPAGGG